MEQFNLPRIVLSATHRGIGANLLGIGIVSELKRRGLGVSCAVVGPNLGQALMYRRIVGRSVRCFDDRLLAPGQVLVAAYQSSVGSDFVFIDGSSAGLYDGYSPNSLRGSAAELAGNLHTPVVMVVDANGFGASLAALVKGYRDSAVDFELAGILLSRFNEGSESVVSRDALDTALSSAGVPPILGAIPEVSSTPLLPDLSCTQSENRTSIGRQFMQELSGIVQRHVDVQGIMDKARHALGIRITEYEHRPLGRRTRIAVADDACFGVMFQDNLEWLRYYGAEIVPFSPLADDRLPSKIGGIYLGGSYLEEYASALGQNTMLKSAIADFVATGGVLYSEGASSAYLARSFKTNKGDTFDGVGIIPGPAVATKGLWSYTDAVTVEESVLGRSGLIVKGINTNEWKLASEERMVRSLRYSLPGSPGFHEGYSPEPQIVSTFAFLHFGSNPELAKNIVDAAEVVQKI